MLPGPLYNFSIHNVEPYESHTSCLGFKVMALAERRSKDCFLVNFSVDRKCIESFDATVPELDHLDSH